MRIIKTNIFLLSVLFILLFSKTVSGLDVKTHELINERIAKTTLNGFSLNDYLINQLGLADGIKEVFDNEEVLEWLALGGRYEDSPPWYPWYSGTVIRSINHFHDPISDMGYNVKGATKLNDLIDSYTFDSFHNFPETVSIVGERDVVSSIDWALLPEKKQDAGYYSWNDVRGYYQEALTNKDQNTRNTNFIKTFRGLGQLMHLVQDASVPSHTRNDQHWSTKPDKNYEIWVREHKKKDAISKYIPKFFTGEMNSYHVGLVDSMASFIDTNQYDGKDPEITAGTTIGLSEYANANFFTKDTNKIDGTTYPYPKIIENMDIEEKVFVNGFKKPKEHKLRRYYKKNKDGEKNGDKGYLLSAENYLDYYYRSTSLNPIEKGAKLTRTAYLLDHNVYSAYADLLLPRAIGYSAGLLKFFFRGELEAVQVPDSNSIKIKNKSSDEMSGIFTLYYDKTDGTRKDVSGGLWIGTLAAGDTNNEFELSFTGPTDMVEGTQYMLVFKGQLGKDANAVVGSVVSTGTAGAGEETTSTGETEASTECGIDFSANVLSGSAPLTVQFTVTTNPDCGYDKWLWDFGDGSIALERIEQNPTHVFSTSGVYTVTLEVYNITWNGSPLSVPLLIRSETSVDITVN